MDTHVSGKYTAVTLNYIHMTV